MRCRKEAMKRFLSIPRRSRTRRYGRWDRSGFAACPLHLRATLRHLARVFYRCSAVFGQSISDLESRPRIGRTWLFVCILWLLATPLAAQLEIHFLNVGQGDAVIVQEGGHTAVIDAGPSGIGAFLRTLQIDTIDLVVASHPHADHIGGMPELLRSHVVRFYLDNGVA